MGGTWEGEREGRETKRKRIGRREEKKMKTGKKEKGRMKKDEFSHKPVKGCSES